MTGTTLLGSRAARMTLVMSCLYAANGVILPYLPRWLEGERGLAGAEIGLILSLAQLLRIVIGPAVAFWADGALDRRTPLRLLALISAAAYAAFFFLAHDFLSLLVIGFFALTATQSLVPFVEAGLLRASAEGKISYGAGRGIGSVAFIVANIAGGALIARFGLGAVAAWVIVGLGSTALASQFALKRDRVRAEPHERAASARWESARGLIANRRFLMLILACGLIQSAHAFYYGFSTLVWRGQGLAPGTIGLLWAFAVVVEVAFLWSLPLVERRLSPETLILIGAGGAVVRWLAMGFAPLGWVLWALQALHALSFAAAHIGAMRLLTRQAPERAAGLAQTLYAALSGGVLLGAATLLSGRLYDASGARGYWAMAAIALLGAALARAMPRT